MLTEMQVTGKPAQFGRGVMADVGDKIIGQFASCVASKLQAQDAPAQETAGESTAETAQVPASVSAPADAASTNGAAASGPALPSTAVAAAPSSTATPARAPSAPMKSEIDAIDLLDTAGAPVLKRLAPVVGGGLLLVLVFFLIRRLRSS